jgi:fluoroquinolone transport system permease protein
MKAVLRAFVGFLRGVIDDYMLVACMLAPLIMGVVFRFGIPQLESFLRESFSQPCVLSPYYLIFDLLIVVTIPMMFSFSGVMTILEELDNGTARYLMVTPIGRSGYLASRILICSVVGMLYSVAIIGFFGLSDMRLIMNLAVSVMCAFTGIIVSVFVIAFANNKVEGMALIKLSGIIIFGIPAVFFLPVPIVYVSCILPSYWLTIMAQSENYLYLLPTLLVSTMWMLLFYKKFSLKLV